MLTFLSIIRSAFIILIVSTCLAQVTKKTEHAWYYFFFIVIMVLMVFNFY